MIQTVLGPASVPSRAVLVKGREGEVLVDWGKERADPAPERVLEDFPALAGLVEPEIGPAVVQLVQRFGPLGLCKEHQRGRLTWEHRDCTALRPEPVQLWAKHAREVARILQVKADLGGTQDPDPFGVLPSKGGRVPRGVSILSRARLEAERIRQRGGASSEEVSILSEELDDWETEVAEVDGEFEKQRRRLSEAQPSTPAGWREWVASNVNDGLGLFPTTLALHVEPESGMLRPVLSDSLSLLSRVYLELALEVSGSGETAFCSGCGHPYVARRKPKRGQANFYPECREARVPQRLHMRRKRAAL
jgi:hypothetical protein